MIAQTTPRPAASAPARSEAAAVIATMADFIISHAASNGSVDRDDLRLDFSDEQIDAHFEAAKALARSRGKPRR